MRDIKNFKGDDTMDKIRNEEVVNAYNKVVDLCVSNYEYIDNDEAEEIDMALDILYKQLFEEGDR
jgi:hypothetical protein